jgi:hypothetical protein
MAENMAVELTPKGTHGVKMRQLPRPIMKIILKFVTLILRLRGAKVLALTTVGAKSGRTHTTDVGAFPDGGKSLADSRVLRRRGEPPGLVLQHGA